MTRLIQPKSLTRVLKSKRRVGDGYCNYLSQIGSVYEDNIIGTKYLVHDYHGLFYELDELIFESKGGKDIKFDLKECIGSVNALVEHKLYFDVEVKDNYAFTVTDINKIQSYVIKILQDISDNNITKISKYVYCYNDKYPTQKLHIIFTDLIVNTKIRKYVYNAIMTKDPLLGRHIDQSAGGLRCIWSTKVEEKEGKKRWAPEKGRYCPKKDDEEHHIDYWSKYSILTNEPLIRIKSQFEDLTSNLQQYKPLDDEKLLEEIEDVKLDILFMSYAQNVADDEDSYFSWRNNIWAIRSLGGTLSLAKKFSAVYQNYDEKSVDDLWGSAKHIKFTIGYVVSQLKKYHPTSYIDIMIKSGMDLISHKKKSLFFTPPKSHAKVECTQIHTDDFVQPFQIPKGKHINYIVQAGLGLGKTTQLINYMNTLPKNSKIIILTSRRSFARSIFGELTAKCNRSFDHYLDIPPDLLKNHKSIIIQVESLHKLQIDDNPNCNDYYDYVIIDEVESILFQMTIESTHGKNLTSNHEMFNNLLKHSKVNIMMDGFVSNKTFDFVDNLGMTYEFHKFTKLPIQRSAYKLKDLVSLMTNLIDTLRKGKKCFLYSSSCNKLVDDIIPNIKCAIPGIRIKEYHKNAPPDDLDKINETWRQYDLVCTTSTITVGCNFDIGCREKEEPYFHQLFCYLNKDSHNLMRDVHQSLKRVRCLVDNKLKYCTDNRLCGNKDFPLSEKLIRKQLQDHKTDLSTNTYKHYYRDYSLEYVDLVVNNILEANMSVILMEQVFNYYLKQNNYVENEFDDIISSVNWLEFGHEYPKYEDIQSITFDECLELKSKKNNGVITQDERNQMLKFYFQTQIIMPHFLDDVERISDYWDRFINHGTDQFHNISYQKGLIEGTVTMEEIADHYGETNIINKGGVLPRLLLMEEVNSHLGLQHSCEEKEIPRDKLQDLVHIMKNGLHANMLLKFGIRDQRKDKQNYSIKNLVATFQSAYGEFGFVEFKFGKRKQKKINGKVTDNTPVQVVDAEQLYTAVRPYSYKKKNQTTTRFKK